MKMYVDANSMYVIVCAILCGGVFGERHMRLVGSIEGTERMWWRLDIGGLWRRPLCSRISLRMSDIQRLGRGRVGKGGWADVRGGMR